MKRSQYLVFTLFLIIGLFYALPSFAAPFELDITPIIGYERVQQVLPTPHTTNTLIYGGRVTAGILLISIEAEYTHGSLQETFPGISVTNANDEAKLGLRSGFGLGSFLRFYLRGGVEAAQERTDMTTNGVTITTIQPITYSPYGGAGVRAQLFGKFSANIDVVAVVPNFSNFNQNEYQTTAGFTVRLP